MTRPWPSACSQDAINFDHHCSMRLPLLFDTMKQSQGLLYIRVPCMLTNNAHLIPLRHTQKIIQSWLATYFCVEVSCLYQASSFFGDKDWSEWTRYCFWNCWRRDSEVCQQCRRQHGIVVLGMCCAIKNLCNRLNMNSYPQSSNQILSLQYTDSFAMDSTISLSSMIRVIKAKQRTAMPSTLSPYIHHNETQALVGSLADRQDQPCLDCGQWQSELWMLPVRSLSTEREQQKGRRNLRGERLLGQRITPAFYTHFEFWNLGCSMWRSSGRRSRVMCCDFCWEWGAGSTVSCQELCDWLGHLDQTRLAG